MVHGERHIGTYWHMRALWSIEVDINNMQSREGGQKKGPDESKTVSEFLFLSSPGFYQFSVLLLSFSNDTQIKIQQRYSVRRCLILPETKELTSMGGVIKSLDPYIRIKTI